MGYAPDFIKTQTKTEATPNPINPRTLKERRLRSFKVPEGRPHFAKRVRLSFPWRKGVRTPIITGNQRLEAAKSLGWATVPVIEVRELRLKRRAMDGER